MPRMYRGSATSLEEADTLLETSQPGIPLTFQDILSRTSSSRKKIVYLKYYWKILFVVCIYYAVPSIQYVVSNYKAYLNDEGFCYYNFECTREFAGLESFNNVISNLGYVLLGTLFVAVVRYQNPDEEDNETTLTGLHLDMSLYYCLGWSIVLEGIFSALYHVCPSRIDFQFDMTFMIIGAALLFLCIYQKRQPTITSGAFRAFGVLGAIVCLNALSLLGVPYKIFWSIAFVLLTYISLQASFHIYYAEKIATSLVGIKSLVYKLASVGYPRDPLRFAFILLANIVNYGLAIYFAISSITGNNTLYATQDFPSCVLALVVMDTWIYLIYYVFMKYRSGEQVYIRVWIVLVVMIGFWVGAVYVYNIPVNNKFLPEKESNELNKPCFLFDYFDYHDTWHFLSATAVVLSFVAVYMLDMDIKYKPRSQIRVF